LTFAYRKDEKIFIDKDKLEYIQVEVRKCLDKLGEELDQRLALELEGSDPNQQRQE
jgi:hypothetical protein